MYSTAQLESGRKRKSQKQDQKGHDVKDRTALMWLADEKKELGKDDEEKQLRCPLVRGSFQRQQTISI